jgi:hypothetical protein
VSSECCVIRRPQPEDAQAIAQPLDADREDVQRMLAVVVDDDHASARRSGIRGSMQYGPHHRVRHRTRAFGLTRWR